MKKGLGIALVIGLVLLLWSKSKAKASTLTEAATTVTKTPAPAPATTPTPLVVNIIGGNPSSMGYAYSPEEGGWRRPWEPSTPVVNPIGWDKYIPVTSQEVRKIVEIEPGFESFISIEDQLRNMGITVETSYEDMIQVTMPMNKIVEVAAIPGVRQVRDPQYAVPLGITMMVAGPSPGAPPPPPGMGYM